VNAPQDEALRAEPPWPGQPALGSSGDGQDEALHAVCQEYAVRLARQTLAEANLPEAWHLALGFAMEIGANGGNGAEFLRRISVLLYSYASTVVTVRQSWTSRSSEIEERSTLAQPSDEMSPELSPEELVPQIVQLSLWSDPRDVEEK